MNMCFEIYQSSSDSNWYWRLWCNSEIIATGHQSYGSYIAALNGVNIVKKCGNTGLCQ